MSNTYLDHLQGEITFVEHKIEQLGFSISNAYHAEVKMYFSRQQDIANTILNELYDISGIPRAISSTKNQTVNVAKSSLYNESAAIYK